MRVTATPPLEPLERIAVQVLASHRADFQQDGVVESSKQVLTVLPGAMPVPLAYTENLEAGKPSLFMVGRATARLSSERQSFRFATESSMPD